MESNGFPMCIHVSAATHALIEKAATWHRIRLREIKGEERAE